MENSISEAVEDESTNAQDCTPAKEDNALGDTLEIEQGKDCEVLQPSDPQDPILESDELRIPTPLSNVPDIDIESVPEGEENEELKRVEENGVAEPDNGRERDEGSGSEEEKEEDQMDVGLQQGLRILKEIMSEANKSVNWPFMNSVDAERLGLYDYYEKVKKPMWLKKSEYLYLYLTSR